MDCVSNTVLSSTGAPLRTVLATFLFRMYTADFSYNSDYCRIQKLSDDTAIVGCISGGDEHE